MASTSETRALIRALEEFHKLSPELTLPSILAFLYINERDGESQNQDYVQSQLGMSSATLTRAVRHWAEFKRPRIKGFNMIETTPDPEDRRYNQVWLKRQGVDLINKITGAMNGNKERK